MVAQLLRMKEAVHAWLAAQPKTFFFSEGIKKLVQRWKKCIEKQGDYVEKLCYYKFYIFVEINFASVVRLIIDSSTYFVKQFAAKFIFSIPHIKISIITIRNNKCTQ